MEFTFAVYGNLDYLICPIGQIRLFSPPRGTPWDLLATLHGDANEKSGGEHQNLGRRSSL
jgi:hypothetical protein